MKKLLQSLFILMLVASAAFAQDRTVTGTVTAKEDGSVLPGVSIQVKGTNVGTQTSADGKFTIKLSSEQTTLTFTYIGFASKTVFVGKSTVINVGLDTDAKALSEVIVVGYGSSKKEAITGSVASIGKEQLELRPITNLSNALAGAAPGIQTTSASGQPGSGVSVRIRGFGSINASSEPLYVVDGSPYFGSIANLNVDDIESMSILKDASSTALYGSSAANGVIIITTKKGSKGKDQLTIRAIQGISDRGIEEYERTNAYQYYPLMWEAYRNSLAYSGTTAMATANTTATNGIKTLLGYNPFNVANTAIVGTDGKINPSAVMLYPEDVDWAKDLSRVGKRGDYALSFNGGNQKSDYYVSLGYVDEKGYVIRSDYNRFTGRLNVNSNPVKWFSTGVNISGTLTKSNQASSTGGTAYVNPFNFTRNIGPIYPVYAHNPTTGAYLLDANGNKIYDQGGMTSLGLPTRASSGSPGRHVIMETMLNKDDFSRNVLSARSFGEATFLKDFKFKLNASVDVNSYLGSTYENKIIGDGAPSGRASKTNTFSTNTNFQQLLSYAKTFTKHSFDLLLAHENNDYNYKYLNGSRNTQILDGITDLGNFTTTAGLSSSTDVYRKEAYFSRFNYNYDDKYFFSGSYRTDGTSKFAEAVRWGKFYSLGAGWVLSKEKFLEESKWVNYLKLRASYGQVGNDGISGYYLYQALYSLGFNNGTEPGYIQSGLATPELAWESSNASDIGLEFTLFNNRLSGSVEYFNRESGNLLFSVPQPVSSGVSSVNKNIGTMYNKGFEVQLGYNLVKSKDFVWKADLNWTKVKNQITKMPTETPEITSGTKKLAVGRSIYDYWLRDWYGVDPYDGAGLYVATAAATTGIRTINGLKLTTDLNSAAYQYSGSAIPDYYGSLTNTFTYKNLSFSFLVNYQVGGKIYDSNYAGLMSNGSYGGALHVDALKRWQNINDVTTVPRMDYAQATNFNAGTSDRWLIDASYFNVRSATLTYKLPSNWVSKVSMKNASLYVTGENLFIQSKRQGLDATQSYSGVSANNYVPGRIISVGLNASF